MLILTLKLSELFFVGNISSVLCSELFSISTLSISYPLQLKNIKDIRYKMSVCFIILS